MRIHVFCIDGKLLLISAFCMLATRCELPIQVLQEGLTLIVLADSGYSFRPSLCVTPGEKQSGE